MLLWLGRAGVAHLVGSGSLLIRVLLYRHHPMHPRLNHPRSLSRCHGGSDGAVLLERIFHRGECCYVCYHVHGTAGDFFAHVMENWLTM